MAQDWRGRLQHSCFSLELRCSEEILEPGKSPGVGDRFSGIRNRQCITEGLQRKVQTAPANRAEIYKKTQKTPTQTCPFPRSLEKQLLPARKSLVSDSIDCVDAELPDAAKPWEFEQLTAGLIREPSIIGITDNQG